jgi:hypothetical protein
MVNYKCIRCGYNTNDKSKMKSHFNRKKLCKSLLNNIDLNLYKEDILNGKIISLKKYEKMAENNGKLQKMAENNGKLQKMAENNGKLQKMAEIYINNNDNLVCQNCNKEFTTKAKLELHLKKKCKMLVSFNNIYKFDGKKLGKNIFKKYKNAGDIYIIQTDYVNNDHYKIGITKHISKRLCQYRCSNTYEPRLHYYFPCQDIKAIDNDLNYGLMRFNVKREIFKGDIEDIKNEIVNIIKKKFNLKEQKVYEPDIKIGDLTECIHCNKYFYTAKDLFKHFNECNEYKESLNKEKELICNFCKKEYSSKKNLWRHIKNSCKEKKTQEEYKRNMNNLVDKLNEQLEKRDKQIDEQNNQIKELIKKVGITQNIQNNIKILAYKNTDLSHLTDNDYMYCLNRSNMVIPNLIKRIHFDPKKPENHNIYIGNIKNKYVMIYDGNKWNLQNQDETIEDIIDINEYVLEQKLEEWVENGNEYPDIMRKFNRYLEKKEKDEVLNAVKEEIKLVLFNNRKVIDIKN